MDYPTKLLTENNIKLLEPYVRATDKHRMQCMTCNHIWSATPVSKVRTMKLNGTSGCPNCDNNRRLERYNIAREANLEWFADNDMVILTEDYTGTRVYKDGEKVTFKNTFCGHTFSSLPANILAKKIVCPVCGTQERMDKLYEANQAIIAERDLTAPEWLLYKRAVRNLTEAVFKTHTAQINPHNYPRGLAGEEGAYHIDHIVSIRHCFDNNIPVELCAHPDNLRMITWEHNVTKKDKIEHIPDVFNELLPA